PLHDALPISGGYRIGCEQAIPFVFSESPLIPSSIPIHVQTLDAMTGAGIPARLEISSSQTARAGYWGMARMELPQVVYTGPDGAGDAFLIPGPEYTLKASRGP